MKGRLTTAGDVPQPQNQPLLTLLIKFETKIVLDIDGELGFSDSARGYGSV